MANKRMSNQRKDRKVFKETADRTKKLNVRPLLFRGGIRL
uniref:Uncharacterized protein n=1 Tax=Dulem virus 137 TaxID=3145614 RepID=A0AAU8AXQ7_9VIRU